MTIFVETLFALLLCLKLVAIHADSFDDTMRRLMNERRIRGMAVVVFDKSIMTEPIVRGYGRIAASNTSPLVTKDTTFQLASVSKTFTASAVAVMLDKGIISSLDEDICNALPRSYAKSACRNPRFPSRKVTWRMLVTHRSSLRPDIPDVRDSRGRWVLPAYGPTGGYWKSYPAAGNPSCPLTDVKGFYRDILINKASQTQVGRVGLTVQGGGKLNWFQLAKQRGSMWLTDSPGARRAYSNFAAGYIAALIEHKTGQSFPNFCNQHLFNKLGMSRTAWHTAGLPAGTRKAVPVKRNRSGGYSNIGDYCYIDYASGELRSTASDLSKWGDAMLKYGTDLWSSSTAAEVFKCQERNQFGNQVSNCEYGMGWAVLNNSMKNNLSPYESFLRPFTSYDWTKGVWHDGSEAGVQTNAVVLPSSGVYVFVLINTEGGNDAQRMTSEAIKAARALR